MNMRHKKMWFLAPAVLIAMGVILYLKFTSSNEPPYRVTIATATPGGTFNLLGGALAGILERLPGKPIERAVAEVTGGSADNIERLIDSRADIAFVTRTALAQSARTKEELRILARLYKDFLHIIVRRDTHIANTDEFRKFFQENKSRKIFIGPVGSGTRIMAKRVFDTIGLADGSYSADDAASFSEAAARLESGDLDAALFVSGTPTQAVQRALESGQCMLLPVDKETRRSLTEAGPELVLVKEEIPAHTYRNQPNPAPTVAAWVFLACRKDLDEDLAYLILDALFDTVADLLLLHARAQDIKLAEAFEVPRDLRLHPGAVRFRKREGNALLVATGALNGKYYQLGSKIQLLLEQRGIDARVTQTAGSLENLEMLGQRPTIAIMQYDAALASRIGLLSAVYNVDLPIRIPRVGNIQRIAALHAEQLHVVAGGNKLAELEKKLNWEQRPITTLSQLAEALRRSPKERIRVCLGPQGSASQVLAQAVLAHHEFDLQSPYILQSFLPVTDMVNRLQHNEIDLGFFTSYVPSEAMKTVLNDERFRLLSLGAKERSKMVGGVFVTSTIEPNTYACQQTDKPVQTLSTQAVVVTTDDLPRDVGTITKAIFEGEAYLGVGQLSRHDMAKHMPSLPLHRDAERYYKEAELLPSEPRFDWLRATWTVLGCLVMLTAGYKGLIMLRRARTGNRIARRILSIPLEADFRVSAQRLLKYREEIQERVRRRWWRWGELDKNRWRDLRTLIQERVAEAKENLTRAFVVEIRGLMNDSELSESERQQRCQSIEDRILEFFERGELDASQQKMLRELLQDGGRRDTVANRSKVARNAGQQSSYSD